MCYDFFQGDFFFFYKHVGKEKGIRGENKIIANLTYSLAQNIGL